jgi:hypothetical protein
MVALGKMRHLHTRFTSDVGIRVCSLLTCQAIPPQNSTHAHVKLSLKTLTGSSCIQTLQSLIEHWVEGGFASFYIHPQISRPA